MKNFAFAGYALAAGLIVVAPCYAAGPLRLMLLDGQSGGPYHDWKHTTPVIQKELEETGLFQVDVVTAPQSGGDFSSFHPDFRRYAAIVSNYDAPDWPADLEASFEEYMKNGGGLVIVHAADNAFPKWEAYNLMIGVGGWRGRDEKSGPHWIFENGRPVADQSPGSAGMHGFRVPFEVTTRDPQHPIMRGLPTEWMHVGDELYGNLRGPGKNMTVLATAHSDPANHGTGKDEPMLMVLTFGKGRVFHTVMGHDIAALSCIGFLTILQRGTEWAATGKVTQKVPALFPNDRTVCFRSDLAAMDPNSALIHLNK